MTQLPSHSRAPVDALLHWQPWQQLMQVDERRAEGKGDEEGYEVDALLMGVMREGIREKGKRSKGGR